MFGSMVSDLSSDLSCQTEDRLVTSRHARSSSRGIPAENESFRISAFPFFLSKDPSDHSGHLDPPLPRASLMGNNMLSPDPELHNSLA